VVAPPATTRDSLLVSAAWLRQHLDDSDVVVVHVDRNRTVYDTAHIPGARYAELGRFITNRDGIPAELPATDQLLALVRELGISNRSRVVLYGDPIAAARLFLTLDVLNQGSTPSMLDGGLAAWRAAGGPTTRDLPTAKASDFQLRAWPELVVTADWVKSRLHDSSTAILDARSPAEYRGEGADTTLPRAGHIAGAGNVDWRSTLVDGRLKPAAELRAMFERAGAGPQDEVVAYCGVGLRASFLYFVSRYLGYRTRLYDGSLAEWSRLSDAPMEKGS
jgi:thiosulfate/3-mercaptopyruvate sulfurtransferase